MPEVGGPAVAIIGAEGEPTSVFASDVERLSYRPAVIVWPVSEFRFDGGAPIATVVDFRALGVHAEQACKAVRGDRVLRKASVIALVFEQEGPRLDLSLGFDDVILAPYRLSELAARLRLARWRGDSNSSPETLRVGALTLNPATYEVLVNRAPIDLTLKEYQLLLFLMRNSGRVFSREELLDRVWEMDYLGGTRTVDVHMRRLRAKTEAAGDLFETVRGVGYRLVVPAAEAD
ncbi:MAG: response regulator transcription factor [Armatimonadetes bacterium]|nr:response regulator transcription factor [Armatimonadota bacterium]